MALPLTWDGHPLSASCPIKPPGPTGVPPRSCDRSKKKKKKKKNHSDRDGRGKRKRWPLCSRRPDYSSGSAQASVVQGGRRQGTGGSMAGRRGRGGGAAALLWVVVLAAAAAAVSRAQLQVGFYDTMCPAAEIIVQEEVSKAASGNPGIAAGLLRLHFHDCFVRGCDGSVLLDSTAGNQAEKDAAPNASLRGFEVIDSAKTRLEQACFGVVSCADILAFAARDALALVGGNAYQVPAGRRDGNVSSAQEAGANLPPPTASVSQITQMFGGKGLSQSDMVALSGAHTVGAARCSSFNGRLYSYGPSGTGQDPSMDPAYLAALTQQCPQGSADPAVPMDPVTPTTFDTNYYANLVAKRGLLASDQALLADPTTTAQVVGYTNSPATFQTDFVAAMVKMGSIEVLTGTAGTIRTSCRVAS